MTFNQENKKSKTFKAIGLMSGTSMDGIDLSLIESDGKEKIKKIATKYQSYDQGFKEKLQKIITKSKNPKEIKLVEEDLTNKHIEIVKNFLKEQNLKNEDIDLIGFHGHTIAHNPSKKITWQIGNGDLLAKKLQIKVISNFRINDVINGGQGAPLVPIYHYYLTKKMAKPLAILNIGGISNATCIFDDNFSNLIAFDICFGNAPSDDLMKEKFNENFDKNGQKASTGKIDFFTADSILKNEIFHKNLPKSFDRDDFKEILAPVNKLQTQDALATFAYILAKAIKINFDKINFFPKEILLCGGGRKNQKIITEIKRIFENNETNKENKDAEKNKVTKESELTKESKLTKESEVKKENKASQYKCKINEIDKIGFNGDDIESEAFAFLAIRSYLDLPITFKNTTGIKPTKIPKNKSKNNIDFQGLTGGNLSEF